MPDVEDPVCKMTFPEETAEELGALKLVRDGRTHWFCSPTCRQEFLADPAKHGRSTSGPDAL